MAMRDSNKRRWRQQNGDDDCSGIGQRRLAANATDGDGGGWRRQMAAAADNDGRQERTREGKGRDRAGNKDSIQHLLETI